MGKLSLYKIPLRSLSEGKHEYKYHLDNGFFSLLDDGTADIKKGDLDVVLSVKKISNTFELNFDIKGTAHVPCDRCLDDIKMEVDTQNRLFVKFGAEYSEESDEVVVIPEEDGEINISWFLYEFILLSIPMKRVHPAGECNKAMTSKMKKYKATSGDDDDLADEEDDDNIDDSDNGGSDPRWDALKDINIDDN